MGEAWKSDRHGEAYETVGTGVLYIPPAGRELEIEWEEEEDYYGDY